MNKRIELAEKLEIVGQMFETPGMAKLMDKLEAGMNIVNFNAVVIQIESKLMQTNPELACRIIKMGSGKSEEEIDAMEDGEFSLALRDAIITEALGFFVSSPRTDGKK